MKKSNKRKLVIAGYILGFLFLTSTCYYGFYSYISNGATVNLCQNINCIPILSLPEFLSISTALLGLFWVVDSLNSWKDQDAYYNSRDISLELKEIIYTCEISIIIEIMKLPDNMSLEEMRSNLKITLPTLGIGSPISNLCHKVEYENIYYREEFRELSGLVERVIFSMWDAVDREKNDFKNIESKIQIATRNDLIRAKQMNDKLNDKLYGLVN